MPPELEVQSLNHWTAREVPKFLFLIIALFSCVYVCDIKTLSVARRRVSLEITYMESYCTRLKTLVFSLLDTKIQANSETSLKQKSFLFNEVICT